MKLCKTIPVFILLFKGYLCSSSYPWKTVPMTATAPVVHAETRDHLSPPLKHQNATSWYGRAPLGNKHDLERRLPTVVVAAVSIALVLLFILIITVFWYAQKKSQEGSMELNPLPYDEPGASLRTISVPENQQEWPFERARQ